MVGAIRKGPVHMFTSVDQVKAAFQPPARFRVSPSLYQAGTTLPGTAKEHQLYVLAGTIEIALDDQAITVSSGFEVDVPASTYWLTVRGAQPASVVRIFDLDSIRAESPRVL